MVQKIILKLLVKKFKLDKLEKVFDYVDKPNEVDKKVRDNSMKLHEHDMRLEAIEKIVHKLKIEEK